MLSADAPTQTTHFYGRDEELAEMTRCLTPGSLEGKRIVLSGLGSLGKTQLARRFQFLHSNHYTSQIWIRINTFKGLDKSFPVSKIVLTINEYEQERGHPQPPSELPFYHVKAILESETNRNWLLIIDDVQDLQGNYRISDFLPNCEHGTIICLTSRKNLGLPTLLRCEEIEVSGLDIDAAANLFLARFNEEYPFTTLQEEGKFD